MSLLETGRHPMTVFTMSTPCSCLSSFPLKKTLRSSFFVFWPKFYLISQNPRMFHLYLSISCVSSWSFSAALSVLIVMLSLPRIFDAAPVACLTPPSWCTAEGAVVVKPAGDRSGRVWLLVSLMVSHGQSTTLRSPFLSMSSTWPLSSSWNSSAILALVFEL